MGERSGSYFNQHPPQSLKNVQLPSPGLQLVAGNSNSQHPQFPSPKPVKLQKQPRQGAISHSLSSRKGSKPGESFNRGNSRLNKARKSQQEPDFVSRVITKGYPKQSSGTTLRSTIPLSSEVNSLYQLKKKEGKGSPSNRNIESASGSILYHCRNRKGYIPIGPETGFKPKENQDSHVEVENFMNVPDLYLFGVYDGHGVFGRRASQFVKTRLPTNIAKFAKQQMDIDEENLSNLGAISDFFTNRPEKVIALSKGCTQTHSDLKKQKFDTAFSGTTACSFILNLNQPEPSVTTFNVGDSRAVLVR